MHEADGQLANSCQQVQEHIYDLRLGEENSNSHYLNLARFSDELLAEIELRAGAALDGYTTHVLEYLREAERTRGEYALDFLTLGMSLRRYTGAALHTSKMAVALARELYWLRRESPWSKPQANLGRAVIIRFFMAPKLGYQASVGEVCLERFPRLIDWLQATGEFEQEVRRLNNWRSYLATLAGAEADRWLKVAFEAFENFERQAAIALGGYTRGVEAFLTAKYPHRGLREDQIFCGRQQAEYHLAMVASEIMNRGMRWQFAQMPRKAVLLPGCMRGPSGVKCQARVFGPDITCTGCNPSCAVKRITSEMHNLGVQVYIVPHSTQFSRWLERWQREPNTGVVAVACLLNILPGGYEMRARRIPSQCVPLDFPGCEKHWDGEGIATGVNEERLVKIVTPAS